LIEWSWVYEPLDADGWIPDFLIRGPWPFLVEVGPCATHDEYVTKGEKARDAYPTVPTMHGPPGDQVRLDVPERWTLVAGITPVYEEPRWLAVAAGWWAVDGLGQTDGSAQWYRCDECGRLGVDSPDYGSYLRPCGHVIPTRWAPGSPIFDRWAEAGNLVQWRAPRGSR